MRYAVNEFIKRVRALKVHMLLLGAVRRALPAVFGKASAQRRLMEEMPSIFHEVCVFVCVCVHGLYLHFVHAV